MKDKMRGTILKTYGDHIESRFWIFLCNKDDVFTVLNFSNDYTEIMQMYDSCKNVYEDFVDFIYDFENDRLLDYGENPDAEEVTSLVELNHEDDYEYVEHPSHYGGDTTYECIKVIEAWGLDKNFDLGTAIRYICRAGNKPENPTLQDLKKAAWYLQREIDKLEKMNDKS